MNLSLWNKFVSSAILLLIMCIHSTTYAANKNIYIKISSEPTYENIIKEEIKKILKIKKAKSEGFKTASMVFKEHNYTPVIIEDKTKSDIIVQLYPSYINGEMSALYYMIFDKIRDNEIDKFINTLTTRDLNDKQTNFIKKIKENNSLAILASSQIYEFNSAEDTNKSIASNILFDIANSLWENSIISVDNLPK